MKRMISLLLGLAFFIGLFGSANASAQVNENNAQWRKPSVQAAETEIIKKSLRVDCYLWNSDVSCKVYPEKLIGKVTMDERKMIPVTVYVILGGKMYLSEISEDGSFYLSYPAQKDGQELNLVFRDAHGCEIGIPETVYNSLAYSKIYDDLSLALSNKLMAFQVEEGLRVYASVAGKVYTSEVSTKKNDRDVTVKYPRQKPGTKITAWLRNDETTETSKKVTFVIKNKDYAHYSRAETNRIDGKIYLDTHGESYLENNITSLAVIVNGKSYPCKWEIIGFDDISDNEWEDMMDSYDDGEYMMGADDYSIYHFKCSYPKQKIGSRIQLRAEDADGYIFTDEIYIENFAPKIKINKVYSGDRKISGTTKAGSAVTVKYGKKTYKTKAGKNGKFTVKVKAQKAGTKVKVSVVTPQGYTNFETVKSKKAMSDVFFAKTIYRTSSSITLKIVKPRQGDKLILKVAGRTYTKKIKRDKSSQKLVVKLRKKPAAGSKVSVVLKDKFGKKKDSEKAMAYYGNVIAVGMSATNAALTTWGRPIRKNNFGTGSIQWVFQSGDTYLYVYVRGGRVVAIQRLNY